MNIYRYITEVNNALIVESHSYSPLLEFLNAF